MIRRQARFLGKPVRAPAAWKHGAIPGKSPERQALFLKQMHEYVDELGSADPKRLELAMQRRALHADEFRCARDVA